MNKHNYNNLYNTWIIIFVVIGIRAGGRGVLWRCGLLISRITTAGCNCGSEALSCRRERIVDQWL